MNEGDENSYTALHLEIDSSEDSNEQWPCTVLKTSLARHLDPASEHQE
jgi:hypothetical protein